MMEPGFEPQLLDSRVQALNYKLCPKSASCAMAKLIFEQIDVFPGLESSFFSPHHTALDSWHFPPHCAASENQNREALDSSTDRGSSQSGHVFPLAWLIPRLPEPLKAKFLAQCTRVGRTLVHSASPVGRGQLPGWKVVCV